MVFSLFHYLIFLKHCTCPQIHRIRLWWLPFSLLCWLVMSTARYLKLWTASFPLHIIVTGCWLPHLTCLTPLIWSQSRWYLGNYVHRKYGLYLKSFAVDANNMPKLQHHLPFIHKHCCSQRKKDRHINSF